MKVVIDINDDTKELLNSEDITERLLAIDNLIRAFKDGTVLPEGHGDLIDRDDLKIQMPTPIEDEYKTAYRIIDNAPTIIPADK